MKLLTISSNYVNCSVLFMNIKCPNIILCIKFSEIHYEWHLVTNLNVYIMTGCLSRENKALTATLSFKIIIWNTRYSKGHANTLYVLQFKIDTLFMNRPICASRICNYDILGFSAKKPLCLRQPVTYQQWQQCIVYYNMLPW